ncbi:MAG: hypothetical protein ACLFV3_05995 [Phycisphaeraceae bacterium]
MLFQPRRHYYRAESSEEAGRQGGAGSTREMAEQAKHQAREQARHWTQWAQEAARDRLDEQKHEAAHRVRAASEALRATSAKLREEDQEQAASYVDSAADRIDRVADYLRERPVTDIWHDVEYQARRHPAIFLGTAAVAGVAVARFLRSSAERREDEEQGHESYAYSRQEPQTEIEPITVVPPAAAGDTTSPPPAAAEEPAPPPPIGEDMSEEISEESPHGPGHTSELSPPPTGPKPEPPAEEGRSQ